MRPEYHVWTKLEVRFRDLDPLGHVNNSVYVSYFEVARVAYMRALAQRIKRDDHPAALNPSVLEFWSLSGAEWVIARAIVDYRSRIYIDDTVHSAARVTAVSRHSFTFGYEVRTGDSFEEGRLAAEGSSVQVFYDPKTKQVRLRPDWFLPAVSMLEGRPENTFDLDSA